MKIAQLKTHTHTHRSRSRSSRAKLNMYTDLLTFTEYKLYTAPYFYVIESGNYVDFMLNLYGLCSYIINCLIINELTLNFRLFFIH